jgi:hypothetical protein
VHCDGRSSSTMLACGMLAFPVRRWERGLAMTVQLRLPWTPDCRDA